MTKLFCDRCEKESPHLYEFIRYKRELISGQGYEMCKSIKDICKVCCEDIDQLLKKKLDTSL